MPLPTPRRALLFATLLLAMLQGPATTQNAVAQDTIKIDGNSAVYYVYSCQKANAAFGPLEQEYTDLAWTYPAVHALKLLGADVPRRDDCRKNGRVDTWRFPYWDHYNLVQLDRLLGARNRFPAGHEVTLKYQPIGKKHWEPEFTLTDEVMSYYDITSLWYVTQSIEARQGGVANPEEALKLVAKEQLPDGSFGGHVIWTAQAVMIYNSLGQKVPQEDKCGNWLQACQTKQGGFRWSPTDNSPSNHEDVYYTMLAIAGLKAMREKPDDRKTCEAWINSLQNNDGGFGDRPGWRSRLASTFYAVQALQSLTGKAKESITEKQLPKPRREKIAGGQYSIFQAHHKSPKGGPEMIDAVAKLKLNLIGVKAPREDVEKLRAYVKEKGYALEVVACPENYSHRMALRGVPEGNHISNMLVPPEMDADGVREYDAVMAAGEKNLPWKEFKQQVISPMMKRNTLFYPEHEYGQMNAYQVYDDGLDGGLGYNALHATHFGDKKPDWIRLYPYRERWLGRLPFLADGDAHGDIKKWTPELNRARVLYLAEKPDLQSYLDASLDGRSVCVLRDKSVPSGIVYYGPQAAVDYLKARKSEWQWWED